jgi:acyl-CoA synthetase (AMP-forming)/AMP-acid ligase II
MLKLQGGIATKTLKGGGERALFITDWLDAWAADQPDKKLFGFVSADGRERDGYSYSRFAGATRLLADWLRQQGLRWGERVVLAYPPGLDMIAAFFACARAGIIAVPTARPPAVEGKSGGRGGAALSRISAIAADCGARIVLTDRPPPRPASGAAAGRCGWGRQDLNRPALQ